MPSYKVMVAEFPYGNQTYWDAAEWVADTVMKMKRDPLIDSVHRWKKSDTPITMTRNKCIVEAQRIGADYVLMVDSDMRPDYEVGLVPGAKPFWETAWEFALDARDRGEVVCIGAPYCGPPPNENVYVFKWDNLQCANPNPDFTLSQYSRYEVSDLTGVKECAALPTGVFLMDMRAIERLNVTKKPVEEVLEGYKNGTISLDWAKHMLKSGEGWFYYEWKDKTASEKASTEDVTFSRDLSFCGVKNYCTWDSWAAHIKMKYVLKPSRVKLKDISAQMRQGLQLAEKECKPNG